MMTIRFLLFLTLVLSPATALGQAYCSLRDPVATMQAFFPDLDHYRSAVREITEADQSNILRTLPFTIHKNELATHTLYTVFSEDHALTGIVHVRTERGRWGLTEIAWLFDPELRIVGVRLQRSRNRHRSYIESEPFQAILRGKNFDELRTLLTPDGKTINDAILVVPTEARELATTVIRSALKTIAVTTSVWGDTLQVAKDPARPISGGPS